MPYVVTPGAEGGWGGGGGTVSGQMVKFDWMDTSVLSLARKREVIVPLLIYSFQHTHLFQFDKNQSFCKRR